MKFKVGMKCVLRNTTERRMHASWIGCETVVTKILDNDNLEIELLKLTPEAKRYNKLGQIVTFPCILLQPIKMKPVTLKMLIRK